MAPAYAMEESAGRQAGQNFIAAGGARIPNEGQFTLRFRNGCRGKGEGKDINFTLLVAKVTRPLRSVGRICDEGLEGKFNKEEAIIRTKAGKIVCK